MTRSTEPVSTARLTDVVRDFERVLRARAFSPPNAGTSGWKRALWLARRRLRRDPTPDHDWMTVGIATIQTSLAQRLERIEEELFRLRRAVEDIQPDGTRREDVRPVGDDHEGR